MKKLWLFITSDSHLGTKVGVSFVVLIALLLSVGWVGIRQLRRVDADLAKMIDQRWSKVQLSRRAQALSNLNSRITMKVFLVENEKEIESLLGQRAANSEGISRLIKTLRSRVESTEEEALLNAIDEKRNPYINSYKTALQLLEVDKKPAAARAVMVQQTLPRLIEYHEAWNAYVDYQGQQLELAQDRNAASNAATRKTTALLTTLAIFFAGAIAIFVTRNISWHINKHKRDEEALRQARDDLEARVQGRTAELAKANDALEEENTERKQAEASLRESEERYRDLFENANDIIYTHDLKGNYTSVNKICEEIVGYTRDEALKMNISQLIAPEYLEEAKKLLAYKVKEKTLSAYQLEIIAKDGHRVMLEVNSRLTYENGKPNGVQGMARDITERTRVEAERRIISEIVQGIVTTSNLDELLRLTHNSIRRLLAAENCFVTLYDPSTGLMHFDFWADKFDPVPEPRPVGLGFSSYVLRTGQPVLLTEEAMSRMYERGEVEKSGTDSASWLGVPLRTPSGTIGVLVIQHYERAAYSQRDLEFLSAVGDQIALAIERQRGARELEQARDAALESARQKSEFLANMSHEIRTPMNGVIGMTGILLDSELDSDQRDCAETIRSSGETLLTIINDILDFSKIEAGKVQFESLDFDLGNAVEGTVELLAERAHGKQIELASLVHSDVTCALRGDPGRLRQVLTNLTGNAIKFTERGEVIVRAEKDRETDSDTVIRFSVSDTGIGISEAACKNLFQAFTQADGSTTRKYGGTGLGLAISKQLVELMGGEIGVTSIEGKGSTFWFTARFAKQALPVVSPKTGLLSLERLRALIVDDNATNRKILSLQLDSWGMTYDQADSGVRALELLRSAATQGTPYDLAILDFMMPGMDGFELARTIKSEPAIDLIPLVLLTSFGQRGDGVVAREAGISAYLSKPVRQSQLFDCLANVVSQASGSGVPDASPLTLVTKHTLAEARTISDKLILVAEDNIVNQKVAVRQLQKLGYRADTVADGREVLEALGRISYDLVLMDCQMPEMDGYEATAEIRRREGKKKHTAIVAMTAHALEGDRAKCIAAGMDEYITKPVKTDELKRVLELFFSKPPANESDGVATPLVDVEAHARNVRRRDR